jgi:hypothetical protein
MNIALLKMTGSDAVAVFLRAAEFMDPKIARAFIAAIEAIRLRIPAETIARMIERRDFTSLENAFAGHFTSTEWQPYGQAIQQAVLVGVKATSETQGVINGAQEDFEIRVGLNPRLEQFAQTMTSTRIREIDQTTRDTIRQVLQSGTTAGDDPFAIARRIRGSIGLTQRQEAAVNNYERMLRALDPEVLDRKLRDRRSDASVARAINNDKALTDAQVRSLVDRYRDRYIKYRANVIGRTESIRAVQGAQWELFQDMINKGQIDARQVRRTWINTGDGNVRNSHVQIPDLNPRGVGQAETFSSPLGPILYPGDPSAVAANTIQCRCAVFARIISRDLLPSSPGAVVAPPPPPPRPVPSAPPPAPVISDAERRRRIWTNKTADERLNVAPAFMDADPARMAVIEKLGNLKGGVRFLNPGDVDANGKSIYGGAWHEADTLQIAMSSKDTSLRDYQTVMRHEYGHHIDAVIDVYLLENRGALPLQASALQGMASRRAYSAIAADARELEKNLISDVQSPWLAAKPAKGSAAKLSEVQAAQRKLQADIGLIDKASAPAAYAKLEAEFKKRGLDFAEAQQVAQALSFPPYSAGPGPDYTTYSRVENAVKFLIAYDKGDHYTLFNDLASFDQGSLLGGLSDSIGASTIQSIGYGFGHQVSYYEEFYTVSIELERYSKAIGLSDAYTYKSGKRVYGVGTSAQLFANWFEAWTSGNATQYAIFTRFFPRTSKVFEKMVKEAMTT